MQHHAADRPPLAGVGRLRSRVEERADELAIARLDREGRTDDVASDALREADARIARGARAGRAAIETRLGE